METWLFLRPDATLQIDRAAQTAVLHWSRLNGGQPIELHQQPPGLLAALQKLANGGALPASLTRLALNDGGFPAMQRLRALLQQWEKGLLIGRRLVQEQQPLLSLLPSSPSYQFQPDDIAEDKAYQLSRFAYWHRVNGRILLESPLGHSQVLFDEPQLLSLLGHLAAPNTPVQLQAKMPQLAPETVRLLLQFLHNAGALESQDESETAVLQQWEFHDLVFHTGSRAGRFLGDAGGTYRHWGTIPSPPAVKPPMSPDPIPLYRPNMEQLQATDPPLACIMETRTSSWEYGERPITAAQLGEFLFRTARVKEWVDYGRAADGYQEQIEISQRPYPSGGARYPLELYLSISACEGIAPGFYHYDPANHQLHLLSREHSTIEQLLARSRPGPGTVVPQVLITIAARFQRTAWKYERLAYALILKECGVMYQNMYLAATAMDLAPCGLGLGDADLFARLAGTNYYEETCVGEFSLGSRKEKPHDLPQSSIR